MANPVRELFPNEPAAARVILVDENGLPYKAGTGGGGGTGTVTQVDTTAPLTGGPITTTGAVAIPKATASVDGYLAATDFVTFNNKQPAGAYLTAVTADVPLSGSGTSGDHLVIANAAADGATKGAAAFTAADFNAASGVISLDYANGQKASASVPGFLSSADWSTFNGKQAAGNYLVDPGANGIVARSALNTTVNRTITGTANQISVANGDGVSANPTLSVPSSAQLSVAKLTNLTTNGFVKTSGSDGSLSVATSVPFKLFMPCAGGTAAAPNSIWNLPATNPAVAVVTAGTNTLQGTLDFADGANELSAQIDWFIPDDWAGGTVSAKFKWFTTATTGDVVWKLYNVAVADGATNDPSFNAADTVTDTAKGTTLQLNDCSIASLTTTGWAAGSLLHLKVARDPAAGGDTLAATARLIGVELTYLRTM